MARERGEARNGVRRPRAPVILGAVWRRLAARAKRLSPEAKNGVSGQPRLGFARRVQGFQCQFLVPGLSRVLVEDDQPTLGRALFVRGAQ